VTDFPDNFLSESFAVACDLDEGDFLEVYGRTWAHGYGYSEEGQ